MNQVRKKGNVRGALPYATSAACLLALAGCSYFGGEEPAATSSPEPALNLVEAAQIPLGGSAEVVGDVHEPAADHFKQISFLQLSATQSREAAFEEIFELGDELFDTDFNSVV